MSPALGVGAGAMLLALGLLRASQPEGRRDPAGSAPRIRRAWLRRGGVAVALLALGLTGALGGARDLVLLVATSPLAGWALAVAGRRFTAAAAPSRGSRAS